MKKDNKSDYTITYMNKRLTFLSKHAPLTEPEAVKAFIAQHKVSDGSKQNYCHAYNAYCKYYNIQWKMPVYRPEAKHIILPTREKLEMMIARAGQILGIKPQLSMEAGLRPVELCNLKTRGVDLETRTVHPTIAKHGAPRTLKLSVNLTERIQKHIIKHALKPDDKLFKGTADDYGKHYRTMRNALAKKLNDPTIHRIRLYDFRHYFATITYNKTKDILYTKQQMGHRKIETTLIYAQLLDVNDDEWTCRTAKNTAEATQLIESGFEYVTEMDGLRIFRKRR